MKNKDLIKLLQEYDENLNVDFIIFDEQDNWDARLAINEYKDTLSIELIPKDDTLTLQTSK